VIQKRDEFAI